MSEGDRNACALAECEAAMSQLHAFLDHELPDSDADEIRAHLDLCERCFEQFDLDLAVKRMIKRCCGSTAPQELRSKVLLRLASQSSAAE